MSSKYTYITDLAKQVDIPVDGILSRTLHEDEQVKVVLFGFGVGQELSEHTASMPAILHIVQGEGVCRINKQFDPTGAPCVKAKPQDLDPFGIPSRLLIPAPTYHKPGRIF